MLQLVVYFINSNSQINACRVVFRWSMKYTLTEIWCPWEFCFVTDPDDNDEILCEVFRATSEWKNDVNIPHDKYQGEINYWFCGFFRVKYDSVRMKLS